MLIIPLMSQPQPTHHSNAARIQVSPPLPVQQKKPPQNSFRVSKIHVRAALSSRIDSPLQSSPQIPRTPEQGSGSKVSGVWREPKQPLEVCLHWLAVAEQEPAAARTCLVCFVSVGTYLALGPTVFLLELHTLNNIHRLHPVIKDLSVYVREALLLYSTLIHTHYLKFSRKQVKGRSQKLYCCWAFFRS